MNQEVIDFIEALKESWQVELSTSLREVVHLAIPDVQERIQYKKPHFLKMENTLLPSRYQKTQSAL